MVSYFRVTARPSPHYVVCFQHKFTGRFNPKKHKQRRSKRDALSFGRYPDAAVVYLGSQEQVLGVGSDAEDRWRQ
jgi:hypothetical protein